jgi:hypothetical protein
MQDCFAGLIPMIIGAHKERWEKDFFNSLLDLGIPQIYCKI